MSFFIDDALGDEDRLVTLSGGIDLTGPMGDDITIGGEAQWNIGAENGPGGVSGAYNNFATIWNMMGGNLAQSQFVTKMGLEPSWTGGSSMRLDVSILQVASSSSGVSMKAAGSAMKGIAPAAVPDGVGGVMTAPLGYTKGGGTADLVSLRIGGWFNASPFLVGSVAIVPSQDLTSGTKTPLTCAIRVSLIPAKVFSAGDIEGFFIK